jgi:hypothetical protein
MDKIIEKGETQYKIFVEIVGLDYSNIMTPHTYTLTKMGKLNIDDKEFIILAIEELYNNFFSISINITQR